MKGQGGKTNHGGRSRDKTNFLISLCFRLLTVNHNMAVFAVS